METSSKVFVYLANVNNCRQHISLYYQCLSIQEQEKAKKYYHNYLSDRYVISHGILRYILGYHNKQFPQDIQFFNSRYEKPSLNDNNIKFNMSHSHEMVGYIIALNNRVGIDIELHNDKLDVQELASLVFTPTEYRFFNTLQTNEQLVFFYNLWTKKESLIKASGQGLSYPINTIAAMTILPALKIPLTSKDNNHIKEYYSFPLVKIENYSGAIAIEHKISQIFFLEMNGQNNDFNKISLEYFHYSSNGNFIF